MVDRVKRFKNGFITDPKTLRPDHTIADVLAIKSKYGFSGVPITESGDMYGRLLGMVTNRDIGFIDDKTTRLSEIMTPLKDLVIAQESCTLEEANDILKTSKKAKLPIVNSKGEIKWTYFKK